MGISLGDVGDFLTSTSTLGFCDTGGCDSSPDKGFIGSTLGGSSGTNDSSGSSSAFNPLQFLITMDPNKKRLLFLGLGILLVVEIL